MTYAYHVATLELVDGLFNVLHATFLAHILGGEVGVKTSAIPISGYARLA